MKRFVVEFTDPGHAPLAAGPFRSDDRAHEAAALLRHVGMAEVHVSELLPFRDVRNFYIDDEVQS